MIGERLGPYEILASIGAGGMGEVWKARDTRLGRIVAIKKLREQHSERFKQEARSIAALNHPNICQIFDIGDNYLVLEYVEGKPLSSPLPKQEAVRLSIQIASALEAAHKKGIIHRDLKPSNIMVTDEGGVKLLDFGLAKLYEQDQSISNLPTADFPATQAGAILGTVTYMSPEQAQGQPADARSDIFSFGLVLYEMLSGRKAFTGNSNYAVMDAIVKKNPLPLQTSSSLERIVKRCLKKNPSERYQRISEVKVALERAVKEKEPVSSAEPQPSIAVLPFVNMSGDREQEYFSDGLAEEIINALTKIPGLKVAGRTSSFYFRDKDVEFVEIGKKLNVEHILEGSVRKAGKQLRVTAQLIKVADGFHLWSERYDREMTDVFAIQDEISQAITKKLRIRLSGEHPFIKQHTENAEAYKQYLKGRYYILKFTKGSLAKSIEYFRKATEIDSEYALAWSGLSEASFQMGRQGYAPPKSANEQCRQAALRALVLDEMLPEAHCMMATHRIGEFDWKGAESEYLRALEINPICETALLHYTHYYLLPMQRFEEAVAATTKALEQNPLSTINHSILGLVYFDMGQLNRGLEQFQHALELDPNYYLAHSYLGISCIRVGRFDQAIHALESAVRLSDRSPIALGYLCAALAANGRVDQAQKLLHELLRLVKIEFVAPSSFAIAYAALGETEISFDWIEKAIDEHDSRIIYLIGTPVFSLHSHPRYKAILRKMNLES